MRAGGLLAAAFAALGFATAATAQQESWTSSLLPAEGAYFGAAHTVPHGPLWFACNGARDGRPIDDGFADLQAPFTMTLELRHEALGRAATAETRADLRMAVDDVIYQLPPLRFSPRKQWISWAVHLSMGDAMLTDIMDGGAVTVLAGERILSRHGGALGQELSNTMGFCIEEHLRTGLAVPDHAMAALARMRSGAPAGPALPQTDRRARDHAAGMCGGQAEIAPDSLTRVEINGDGRPDTVLFWSGVDCIGGAMAGMIGGGNCGASQCLTSVFVSGTGRGTLPDAELFSQGVVLDPARPGLVGFGLRLAACRDAGLMPDCITWHRWTASGLVRVN
jgi:hypothetical protein